MIEHFARGYSEDDLTPTIVKQCGFVCGQMGERDVKIYCNEVSGMIESTRIVSLTTCAQCGSASPDKCNQPCTDRPCGSYRSIDDNELMSVAEQLRVIDEAQLEAAKRRWLVDESALPRY
jgi:hypothetical protein